MSKKTDIRGCSGMNKEYRCIHGFYPSRQTPIVCRTGNGIPDCCKDRLPVIHDGKGKPIKLKQGEINEQ